MHGVLCLACRMSDKKDHKKAPTPGAAAAAAAAASTLNSDGTVNHQAMRDTLRYVVMQRFETIHSAILDVMISHPNSRDEGKEDETYAELVKDVFSEKTLSDYLLTHEGAARLITSDPFLHNAFMRKPPKEKTPHPKRKFDANNPVASSAATGCDRTNEDGGDGGGTAPNSPQTEHTIPAAQHRYKRSKLNDNGCSKRTTAIQIRFGIAPNLELNETAVRDWYNILSENDQKRVKTELDALRTSHSLLSRIELMMEFVRRVQDEYLEQ